jgi:hypothetical protein
MWMPESRPVRRKDNLMSTGLNDDDLLSELRSECARLESPERPAVLGGYGTEGYDGVARLYQVRDEALSRGLPLPANCPTDRMER